jgi:hypothetical protein
MRSVRAVGVLTVFAVVSFSADAFAQKIRNYGDQAVETYGTQEGAPDRAVEAAQGQQQAPQVTAPQAQGQQGGQQQGQETQELQPSYVTVFRPGGAQAPLPVDLSPDKMYRGIIPGTRDEVSHLTKAQEKGSQSGNVNYVTWVGFQANDDSTRVFFQTAREADYSIGQGEEGAVTVTFNDARLSARNFGRFVDTSFFDRNVTQIRLKQVDKRTVVATISLQQYESPDVDRNGNYLYLDFPHTPSTSASQSEDGTSSGE